MIDAREKLLFAGLIVGIGAAVLFLLVAGVIPSRSRKGLVPMLSSVVVSEDNTTITIQVNADLLKRKEGGGSFHPDCVMVDHHFVVEDEWQGEYFLRDGIHLKLVDFYVLGSGELVVRVPRRAESSIEIRGILFSGLGPWRFTLTGLFAKRSDGKWKALYLSAGRIDTDELAKDTLMNLYQAQKMYSNEFSTFAGLQQIAAMQRIDSRIIESIAGRWPKDGYYYTLGVEDESWWCSAFPKAKRVTGSKAYRIDDTGVMTFQIHADVSPDTKKGWVPLESPSDTIPHQGAPK
jgi:hypothetical protein